MVIVMHAPTVNQIDNVLEQLTQQGLTAHCVENLDQVIITVTGKYNEETVKNCKRLPGVNKVVPVMTSFKLVSRECQAGNTIVNVGHTSFGGNNVPVIAGPCAVESYEQLLETALAVKNAGASILRGGAYKPRTSPYSFQGLEQEGLKIIKSVSKEVGLPVVSEITDPRAVEFMVEYVDMLQIGTRNMQNYVLLKELAKTNIPILLKRGMSATIEELLMAAEYLMSGGNSNIVLCERGIRTFEPYTRNTLDLNAVPLVKHLSHLPIIVDPSHGTGIWRLVGPMSKAAIAAGADGLMIEVHPMPEQAVSDGCQSLTPNNFLQLMKELDSYIKLRKDNVQ